jgi:1,4-alpha-glucan branching enzyme
LVVYLVRDYEGNHNSLYEKLGAHLATVDGQRGTYFAVWAPDAYSVSVIGEFNAWNKASHPWACAAAPASDTSTLGNISGDPAGVP